MENQLKNEQSPYLKQHKDNPVNWLSWKKENLEKAKNEKKPPANAVVDVFALAGFI